MLILHAAWVTASAVLALALLLTFVPRFGAGGRRVSDFIARAPMLDVVVASLTWVPWVVASAIGGWRGFVGAIVGQMVAMGLWILIHELMYREAARGPRIVKFLNRTVGRWRNHLALWVTVIALPAFWIIRFIQYVAYPPLVWLLRFPRYRHAEWVNVSRQKFDGLVGHDLIWCLYCDWMTGVYSLGGEMLRNVESFWCPIRFYDGKKCENCRIDFPDVDNGWVKPDGTMADVEKVMQDKYGQGEHAWFGHPVRLTIGGKKIATENTEGTAEKEKTE
jgi:hypothetical protein